MDELQFASAMAYAELLDYFGTDRRFTDKLKAIGNYITALEQQAQPAIKDVSMPPEVTVFDADRFPHSEPIRMTIAGNTPGANIAFGSAGIAPMSTPSEQEEKPIKRGKK